MVMKTKKESYEEHLRAGAPRLSSLVAVSSAAVRGQKVKKREFAGGRPAQTPPSLDERERSEPSRVVPCRRHRVWGLLEAGAAPPPVPSDDAPFATSAKLLVGGGRAGDRCARGVEAREAKCPGKLAHRSRARRKTSERREV